MTRWFNSLRRKLRRPDVGAAGELKTLRMIEVGHPWIDRLTKRSSWLIFIFVAVGILIPRPERPRWNISALVSILVGYVIYIVVLETSSRALAEKYDLLPLRLLRIVINLTVVTALIYFSGGAESYYWCLYAVPLFQANMYLRGWGVVLVFLLTLLLYAGISSPVFGITTTPGSFGLLLTNSLVLLAVAILLNWLFEGRRIENEIRESLQATVLTSSGQLDQQTLDTIIRGAVAVLNASGGGIYEYDQAREELTVVADYGGVRSIKGHKLKKGLGMAGRVVENQVGMIVHDYSTWKWRCPELEPGLFRAVIEVPLALPDRIIGVLYVTDDRWGRRFNIGDADVLKVLASHAAISMNNAARFEASRKNIARLQLLGNVSSKMTYARNLKENLTTILEEALKAVSAVNGSMMIVDPKSGDLDILALIIDNEDRKPSSQKRKDGIAAAVAETGEPINCTDTEKDPRYVKSEDRVIRSILSVPIIKNKKLFCLINADDPNPHHFKDEDIQLFSILGEHVATMIESLRLREAVMSLSSLPLDKLQSEIAESAFTLIRGDIAILNLQAKDGSIERAATFPVDEHKTLRLPSIDALTSRILKDGRFLIVNDVEASGVNPELKAQGIKSLIGIPLLADGASPTNKAIGVLFVFSRTGREFGLSEKQILETLARQAASAIIQRRLHDELTAKFHFQERLLSSAFDAIIAVNKKGLVSEFNTGAEKILGFSRDEVIDTNVTEYYRSEKDAQEIRQLLRDEKNNRRIINHYTYVKAKNGTTIPIRLSATKMDEGSVGFFRDLSDLEHFHEARQQLPGLPSDDPTSETDDLTKMLETSAKGAMETLQADAAWIYYYDREKKAFQLPATKYPAEVSAGVDDRLLSLAKKLFDSDEVLLIEMAHDPASTHQAIKTNGFESFVGAPLQVKNQTLGVMILGYVNAVSFDKNRQLLIRYYASDTAIKLDRTIELSRQNALLEGFYKTSLSLTTEAALDGALQSVVDFATEATGAKFGALGIVSPTEQINPFLHTGLKAELTGRPTGKGLLGRMFKEGEEINEPDAENSIHFSDYGDTEGHPKITSFLGVPINIDGKGVGNIYVSNKKGTFSNQDQRILRILSTWAAGAVKSFNERKYATAKEAITIASVLLSQFAYLAEEERRQTVKVLQQLKLRLLSDDDHKAFDQFIATLGDVESVIRGTKQSLAEGLSKLVYMDHLLVKVAQKRSEESGIRIERELVEPCSIRGNEFMLERACTILIDNAIRAIEKGGRPDGTITVSCHVQDDLVRGTITDTGVGVSKEIESDLFVNLLEGRKDRNNSSFLVGWILRAHEGDIVITKTNSSGTTVDFWLPEAIN